MTEPDRETELHQRIEALEARLAEMEIRASEMGDRAGGGLMDAIDALLEALLWTASPRLGPAAATRRSTSTTPKGGRRSLAARWVVLHAFYGRCASSQRMNSRT